MKMDEIIQRISRLILWSIEREKKCVTDEAKRELQKLSAELMLIQMKLEEMDGR